MNEQNEKVLLTEIIPAEKLKDLIRKIWSRNIGNVAADRNKKGNVKTPVKMPKQPSLPFEPSKTSSRKSTTAAKSLRQMPSLASLATGAIEEPHSRTPKQMSFRLGSKAVQAPRKDIETGIPSSPEDMPSAQVKDKYISDVFWTIDNFNTYYGTYVGPDLSAYGFYIFPYGYVKRGQIFNIYSNWFIKKRRMFMQRWNMAMELKKLGKVVHFRDDPKSGKVAEYLSDMAAKKMKKNREKLIKLAGLTLDLRPKEGKKLTPEMRKIIKGIRGGPSLSTSDIANKQAYVEKRIYEIYRAKENDW